jgi:thioredoxin 1
MRADKDNTQLMTEAGSKDRIQSVTGSTFDTLVLAGEGPIVVEFMSYGCGHCQAIEPILQKVAEVLQPGEKWFRVNVAVEQDLANRCEIVGTPTLIMFLNGIVVGRDEGPVPSLAGVLAAVQAPYVS